MQVVSNPYRTNHLGQYRTSENSVQKVRINYFYGFNGYEGDSEIKGQGNSYTTEFRQLDPRLGRWLTIDPLAKEFASWSPYNSFACNPLSFIDPDGQAPQDWIKKVGSNKWEYDSGVQTQAGAEARYGAGTEYKDDGETYQGSYGGKDIGTVTLNTGGKQTWEGGSYQNKDLNPLPTPSVSLPNPFNWYDPSSKGNTLFGAGTSLMTLGGTFKNADLYSQGYRKGISGNYKLEGRNANLFKNAPMKTYTTPISNLSKMANGLGQVSFFGGVVLDGIGVVNHFKNGEGTANSVHPGKAAVNLGFGIIGTGISKIGLRANPVIGILYSGVDSFFPGGWIGNDKHQGAIRYTSGLTDRNRKIVPNFNLYRDVPGGF